MQLFPSPLLTLIKRELLTGLRTWRPFFLLIALLVVLYWNAFYAMATVAEGYIFMAPAMQGLFFSQMLALGFIAFAVVPAMAAASYNIEHQEGNYDLLLTTLIPPRTIALGKYMAVLIRALLIGVAVLPFIALVYFYAGVDLNQFFGSMAVIIPAGLCNAAAGIWCSRIIAKPARSIFATFAIVIGMALAIPAAYELYENMRFLEHREPVATLKRFVTANPANPFLLYGAYQLLAALAFLLDAMFGFRQMRVPLLSRRLSDDAPRLTLRHRLAQRFRAPFRPIPSAANPLGWKDRCGSVTSSFSGACAVFLITALAYLTLYAWLFHESPESVFSLAGIERVLIVLVIPPLVAVLMVKEREETTFDMLRVTLLDAGHLVTGKIAVLVRILLPVLVAMYLCKFFVLIRSTVPEVVQYGPPGYVYWLDFLLLPVHFMLVVCTALMGASFAKKLVPAIACASGCVYAGTLLALYIQFQLLNTTSSGEVDTVLAFLSGHGAIALFAFVITLSVAAIRLSQLWSEQAR